MAETKSNPRILVFLCAVMFFDAVGFGIILPVLPDLIGELSDLPNSRSAEVAGYLLFTFAAVQFFCAPILGGLSDRYGRRPILLLALLGFSLDYFVMAAAPTLLWLFVARFLSGIFGATFPTANACVVDTTSKEDRAKIFGLTGAAVGLGFIFGPAIGGLIGEYSTRLPFVVAGILAGLTCLYGYFFFPETLAEENRRPFKLARANPLGSLWQISHYSVVIVLVGVLFFVQFSNQSYSSIWSFYTIEVAGWSPFYIGLSVAVYGLAMAIVQAGLTGPVVKRFGEVKAIWFGLSVGVISYIGLAFANGPVGIYAFAIFGALSGFAFPALQSLMTKNTPENAQGELQGAIASAYSITAIIGPLVMAGLFSAYSDEIGAYFPGAPFIGGALLIGLAGLVFLIAAHRLRNAMSEA